MRCFPSRAFNTLQPLLVDVTWPLVTPELRDRVNRQSPCSKRIRTYLKSDVWRLKFWAVFEL